MNTAEAFELFKKGYTVLVTIINASDGVETLHLINENGWLRRLDRFPHNTNYWLYLRPQVTLKVKPNGERISVMYGGMLYTHKEYFDRRIASATSQRKIEDDAYLSRGALLSPIMLNILQVLKRRGECEYYELKELFENRIRINALICSLNYLVKKGLVKADMRGDCEDPAFTLVTHRVRGFL